MRDFGLDKYIAKDAGVIREGQARGNSSGRLEAHCTGLNLKLEGEAIASGKACTGIELGGVKTALGMWELPRAIMHKHIGGVRI